MSTRPPVKDWEHDFDHTVEHCRFVGHVPVNHRRIPPDLLAEATHR